MFVQVNISVKMFLSLVVEGMSNRVEKLLESVLSLFYVTIGIVVYLNNCVIEYLDSTKCPFIASVREYMKVFLNMIFSSKKYRRVGKFSIQLEFLKF